MAYRAAVYAREVYQELEADAAASGRKLTRYTARVRAIVKAEQPDLAAHLLQVDKHLRRQLTTPDFRVRKVRGRPRKHPSKTRA